MKIDAANLAEFLKELPRTLVGDGGSPNVHFVTNCNTAEVVAVFIGDDPRMEKAAIELADSFRGPYMVEDRQTGVVHDNPASERIQMAEDA